jgi:hypothetical protein
MRRHLSTGVSTIVALMAAHRATSGRAGALSAYCQEEVARIDAYLRADEAAGLVDTAEEPAPLVSRPAPPRQRS